MSRKKLRRAAKALAGIGAAYLGSKMLGSKMEQMKRAKGIGTSVDTDTEFKGNVSNLTKKGMKRKMEDSVVSKPKPVQFKEPFNKKSAFVNRDPSKGAVGIYKGGKKVSGLNQKAINVLADGKIQTKGVTYANKKAYSDAMNAARTKRRNKILSRGTSNFGLGPMGGAKTGKFVTAKCKLGRNKKTKLS
jgi:hypothetical protein|tara:strand:- start:849 stop:1415 length:567 start_codon:yes stop_codon:yes gene_type:complete